MKAPSTNALSRTVRDFFTNYLPCLRGTSPHTIRSYRDSLTLLLRFLAAHRGYDLLQLDLDDIADDDIVAFLEHLETERGNKASTRNVRLAALHTFFRYAAAHDPEQLERSRRILAIPFKRAPQRCVEYLERDELKAVLDTVDRSTCSGRRHYALLATMFNTGARVQELLDVHANDLRLVPPYQIRFFGKGRKERFCPLWPQTAELLRTLCEENALDPGASLPVFLNERGNRLGRFGARYILAKYLERARKTTPSLKDKRLHPHSMRHTTAVHLLKSGVDMSTISQWLGHASLNTTNRYATVDLDMKRDALKRLEPIEDGLALPPSWRSDSTIIDWLEAL